MAMLESIEEQACCFIYALKREMPWGFQPVTAVNPIGRMDLLVDLAAWIFSANCGVRNPGTLGSGCRRAKSGVRRMPESVWPYDVVTDPRIGAPPGPAGLRCFVLIRSQPKEIWDDLFAFIQSVSEMVKKDLQVSTFDVVRATDIVSPGVIHYEIWDEIKKADLVIADVTGHNANVMFELGVAASVKSKQRVILLREISDEPNPFPFDMMPARHITYTRTYRGFQRLRSQLLEAIFQALAGAPFDEIPIIEPGLPFEASFDDGRDNPLIWTSDLAHRRMLPDCLEFGSLHAFRYSWASMANLKLERVRVQAELSMRSVGFRKSDEWIGVSVRNQGFYANFGWLVHVREDGGVHITIPKSEEGDYDTEELGATSPPMGRTDPFVRFDVAVTDDGLKVQVDGVKWSKPLRELPYVFTRGRILFQTAFARAGIRHVRVSVP